MPLAKSIIVSLGSPGLKMMLFGSKCCALRLKINSSRMISGANLIYSILFIFLFKNCFQWSSYPCVCYFRISTTTGKF